MNAVCVQADDLTDNFQAHLNQATLDTLTKDLGALLGGGSFHQGKALGFPLGFDVGVHVPVVSLQDGNKILDDNGSTAQALWGQAELGLPARINLIGRLGKMLDGDLVGGGFRYGLLKPLLPAIPAISVMGLYSRMEHPYFDLDTISANIVLSFNLPFILPYLGAGYDYSRMDLSPEAFAGVSPTVSRSLDGEANGYRVEGGINLSVVPFTYITLGAGLANGKSMYHAGAGVKF